jgi:hypothetical protein
MPEYPIPVIWTRRTSCQDCLETTQHLSLYLAVIHFARVSIDSLASMVVVYVKLNTDIWNMQEAITVPLLSTIRIERQ